MMGKTLIIDGVDFAENAIDKSDLLENKSYTNTQLLDGAIDGFSSANTGTVSAMAGYKHKVVDVDGYSKVVINGWYPRHVGAFYNSKTNIGTSAFVNEASLYKSGDGTITDYVVNIPTGAVSFSLNLNISYTNQTLEVRVL